MLHPRRRAQAAFGPAGVLFALASLIPLTLLGCEKKPEGDVVTLYTSVDEPFARQVVAEFEKETGVRVQLRTDTEAGKTTTLVRRIEAEQNRPQADVFWSSELFNTIRMAEKGLLVPYRPPADDIPDRYKDPEGRWIAFGLRARVIGYNTQEVKPEDLPARWRDLPNPRWSGRLGMADPRFGTTGGHFAAFLVLWGEEEYVAFLRELKSMLGGPLMDGNATAAREVGRGRLHLCATDTDDVYARQERGEPVAMTYPDMGDGGTLLIPNSVGLVAGAPHPDAARRLIDFLASARTERLLAQSESRNIPVRESLRAELKIDMPPETKVPFADIAHAFERALELASKELLNPQ